MSYKRDYYISVNDEHVVITKNANTPFEVVAEDINNASIRYTYKVGDRILTPFGIETIKEIIKDYSLQHGYAKTYNGGVRSHISNAAKHKTKTAYGYRWEYAQ